MLGTPVEPPAPLRAGDFGADVARLQVLLDLPADGVFGPDTQAAVVLFQQDNDLPADGVVGAKTWAALRADDEC